MTRWSKGAFFCLIPGMAWYEIINAKSDSYIADRDAKIFCANWPRPYRPKMARWKQRSFMV